MEYQKLKDIKKKNNWFGLSNDDRVSINELHDKEIIFFEYLQVKIKDKQKIVVKFSYPNDDEKYSFFITGSFVMEDRLKKDKDLMPFIATIKKYKNYTAYE